MLRPAHSQTPATLTLPGMHGLQGVLGSAWGVPSNLSTFLLLWGQEVGAAAPEKGSCPRSRRGAVSSGISGRLGLRRDHGGGGRAPQEPGSSSAQPWHPPFGFTGQWVHGAPAAFSACPAFSTFRAHQATAPYLYPMSPVTLCLDRRPRAGMAVQRQRLGDAGRVRALLETQPPFSAAVRRGLPVRVCTRVCVREPGPARVEAPVCPLVSHSRLRLLWQARPLPPVYSRSQGQGQGRGQGRSLAAPPPRAGPGRGSRETKDSAARSRRRGVGGGVVAFAPAGGHRKLCEAAVVAEGSSELDVLAVTPRKERSGHGPP